MGRRIIICDGAESARLWSRIGADELEELNWVPRDDESRSRPSGFKILQGGLDEEAIAKLEPALDDEYALVSDDGPWIRLAVREIRKVNVDAPILVLSDSLLEDDVPDHPSLRRTGWKTLIRDDINEEFDHLANLQRVVKIRTLLGGCEKVGSSCNPTRTPTASPVPTRSGPCSVASARRPRSFRSGRSGARKTRRCAKRSESKSASSHRMS